MPSLGAPPRPPMRLAFLSDKQQAGILRQLSLFPSLPEWTAFVPVSDALTVWHPSSPLSDAARRAFTRLTVNGGPRVVQTGTLLPAGADMLLLSDVLQKAVGSVEALILNGGMSWLGLNAILDPEARQCLLLRRLDISGLPAGPVASALLSATRGRLQSLTATGCQGASVQAHCQVLEGLVLCTRPANLANLLFVVGGALARLETPGPWKLRKDDLDTIRTSRPALRDTAVDVADNSLPAYARMLESYAGQLAFASLGDMPTILCHQVDLKCPNLRTTIGQNELRDMLATILALGPSHTHRLCE